MQKADRQKQIGHARPEDRVHVRAYLGYGGREDNNFVELSNSLHELIDTWPLYYVDVVIVALDFHGDGKVGLVKYLRTG